MVVQSLASITRQKVPTSAANTNGVSLRAPRRPNGSKKAINADLPAMIDIAIWSEVFIPTCIDIIGNSDTPFDFTEPAIFEMVIEAFKVCFPDAGYVPNFDSLEFQLVSINHVYIISTNQVTSSLDSSTDSRVAQQNVKQGARRTSQILSSSSSRDCRRSCFVHCKSAIRMPVCVS